jgi:hypothetical protein
MDLYFYATLRLESRVAWLRYLHQPFRLPKTGQENILQSEHFLGILMGIKGHSLQ